MTNNLERRIKEHNTGHTKSTKNNTWEIVYKEELPDRPSARKREKYLKSAAGRRYLQKILASYLPDIIQSGGPARHYSFRRGSMDRIPR